MDSNLKRITWVTVLLLIVCVIAAVLLTNEPKTEHNNKTAQTMQTEPATETAAVVSEEELSAFMSDAAFFDKEPNDYLAMIEAGGQRQYDLQVTSVEKDLRIKIMDAAGDPVVSHPFRVTVGEEGVYEDTDQDGIIYIDSLRAGDYEVSLLPLQEESKAPMPRVMVTVKDEVAYTLIADIDSFLKTEDEIDAKAEDTGKNEAVAEADGTERKTQVLSEDSEFGIDVSKWNKEIEWDKVKKAGVQFAIIRCGYRGSKTGALVEDPYFAKNIEGATEAGIKVGVYFFTQATTAVEAVEEASIAVSLCGKYKLDYPIFIDTEGAGGNGRADQLDNAMRTEVCQAFCETVQNAGYTGGVYASKNWYRNHLQADALTPHAIWLAEYKEAPTYTGDFHMWQYTSSGSVAGIQGRVDLNLSLLK
ncbi:MAG: glycoside hydrolase family 25 protein [Lachnospiraceae bacterium]